MKAIFSKGKYDIVLTEAERKMLAKGETTLSCVIRFLDVKPVLEKILLVKSRSTTMIAIMKHKFDGLGFQYSNEYALYKAGESNIQIIIPLGTMQELKKADESYRFNFKDSTRFTFSKDDVFLGKETARLYDESIK